MKFGKGIVKKYSREYNRTLKNGEKKKYKTEQIQITVPKNEDIYTNKEEVLIIPSSEIEDFKSREEENDFLKAANYLYVMEVEKLNEEIDMNKNSTLKYESEIEELKSEIASLKTIEEENVEQIKQENEEIKDKHTKLIIENENLKTKFTNMKTEHENLKSKHSRIKE